MSYLQLTQRWTPLKFHPEQSRAWFHPARFKTIHAGRRSGKTELFGKRKPVLWLFDCLTAPRPWQDPRRFIAAPTRDQVKDIYWRHIKALTPRKWVESISETELSITTRWGAQLKLVGLDKPERVEGQPWDGGTIDEYANTKPGLFDAHIRPAIADRQGSVDLLGVPDFNGPAQAEYERFCELGRSGNDFEWADFCWGSEGILPDSEIESMRRSMDPRLFDQETTGRFLLATGRAFPDFGSENVKPCGYRPELPLCWSLDFNINPNCSIVAQHYQGEVQVIDELVLPDTRTERVCESFLERSERNGWNLQGLRIYGDPAGNQRKSSAAQTDWQIVRNAVKHLGDVRFKVGASHRAIRDTVNSVNARILGADGSRNLLIDPKCKQTIEDFRAAQAGTDLEEQHCIAAVRYFISWEYPIRSNRSEAIAQFGSVQ